MTARAERHEKPAPDADWCPWCGNDQPNGDFCSDACASEFRKDVAKSRGQGRVVYLAARAQGLGDKPRKRGRPRNDAS